MMRKNSDVKVGQNTTFQLPREDWLAQKLCYATQITQIVHLQLVAELYGIAATIFPPHLGPRMTICNSAVLEYNSTYTPFHILKNARAF